MPIVNEGLTQYSQIVKATSKIESEGAGDFHFARVNVVGSVADLDIMGLAVVFNGTDFEPYAAQNLGAIAASTLPNEAPVAIVVGSKMGKGINKEKVALTASAVEYTVIYRGEAIVANLPVAANAAFKVALEKQGIAVQASAEVVTPTF
tara:strand:- start:3113 stop:3559 length:447 start_codon:yes stop_codon:yes gene_type:complete